MQLSLANTFGETLLVCHLLSSENSKKIVGVSDEDLKSYVFLRYGLGFIEF